MITENINEKWWKNYYKKNKVGTINGSRIVMRDIFLDG